MVILRKNQTHASMMSCNKAIVYLKFAGSMRELPTKSSSLRMMKNSASILIPAIYRKTTKEIFYPELAAEIPAIRPACKIGNAYEV